MIIIIAEEVAANLEAAKKAVTHFQEHEFIFVDSAIEAYKRLSDADAVVTDMFAFSGKKHSFITYSNTDGFVPVPDPSISKTDPVSWIAAIKNVIAKL